MAKPPHTGGEMRGSYPVFRWWKLPAAWRYTAFSTDTHGFQVANGREAWTHGHIPGSGFADLMQDLSDRNSPLPFMMPPATQFADAMSRYGVGEGTHVVLYD